MMPLQVLVLLSVSFAVDPGGAACADFPPLEPPRWQVRCRARLEEARALTAKKDPSLKNLDVQLAFFGDETRLVVAEGKPFDASIWARDSRRRDPVVTPWTETKEEGVKTTSRYAKGREATIRDSGSSPEQFAAFSAAFRPALDDCLAMPEWSVAGVDGTIAAAEYKIKLLSFLLNARYDPDSPDTQDGTAMREYMIAEIASVTAEVDALTNSKKTGANGRDATSLARLRSLSERATRLRTELRHGGGPEPKSEPDLDAAFTKALSEKRCRDASDVQHDLRSQYPESQKTEDLRLLQLGQCYYADSKPYRACAVLLRLASSYPESQHVANAHLYCGLSYELMCDDHSAELEYRESLRVKPTGEAAAQAQQKLKQIEARRNGRPAQ